MRRACLAYTLCGCAQFFPAGVLTVGAVEARKLPDKDSIGRQDPYVVFTLDGECRSFRQLTKVDTDGGTEPVWNQVFQFDVVDHYILKVRICVVVVLPTVSMLLPAFSLYRWKFLTRIYLTRTTSSVVLTFPCCRCSRRVSVTAGFLSSALAVACFLSPKVDVTVVVWFCAGPLPSGAVTSIKVKSS
jgi:hypothetical protein